MKAKVYVRCDGSSTIGLGHIVRCMALAQMLKNDFEVIFFCKEIPPALAQDITRAGFQLQMLESDEKFLQLVSASAIVVIDGYHFSKTFQQSIKKAGASIVCIDDLYQDDFFADLIINQVPGVSATDYNAKIYTQFALGPDYVLLRQPFLEAATQKRQISEIDSVLICFGGADPKNLTYQAALVAMRFNTFKKIVVVIGQAYTSQQQLMLLAKSDLRISIHVGVEANDMIKLFYETQLAIVPSSGILVEAMATHSCIISGAYVDNQRLVYDAYKNQNAFVDADNFSTPEIEKAIEIALKSPSQSTITIDGLSGNRLLKKFKQLTEAEQIFPRLASNSDVDITFGWASNPIVRAFSFQKNEIKREEHETWFGKKIQDRNCVYFVADFEGEAVGSIRYDIQNSEALISYLVDPRYHSKGFGLFLIVRTLQPLLNELKGRGIRIQSIAGYVMPDNYPSRKTFVNLGFEEIEENGKLKFVKKVEW